MNKVDILENDILQRYPDVLAELLRDHTTGRNIFWATKHPEVLSGQGKGTKAKITSKSFEKFSHIFKDEKTDNDAVKILGRRASEGLCVDEYFDD